ncbi:MAG: hypothetical protein GXO59_02465 [Dictyoglomi bacterium]|nr:hypothetical protein [Dictyoglomota bacterium]
MLSALYDKKFVQISGGFHGFAIEMPTNDWKKTYALSSQNIRVLSAPGVFRAVVIGETEGEVEDLFRMIRDKLNNVSDDTAPAEDISLIHNILYEYLDEKVVGDIAPYIVSSVTTLGFDDVESNLVVIPTPETIYETTVSGIPGVLIMKVWFVPIGKTEDILYLMGVLPAFNPATIVDSMEIPGSIKMPTIISSGVSSDRLGNTFIIAPWILVPVDEEKKGRTFIDSIFSITSMDFLPQELVKRNTLDAFRGRLKTSLSILFNRPSARLLTIMDITSPLRSRLLPEDIVSLVPRMDLIGFKRIFRVIRTSPVKDIVAYPEVKV